MKRFWSAALCLVILCGLALSAGAQELYIPKVEGLAEDFLLGMDVSSVLSLERSGVTFRDASGQEKDLFLILKENGIDCIRVRVWNDPFDSSGRSYGGGGCGLANAVEIGRRAAAAGQTLLVDFHYSDFWADPAKQQAPKAWRGMTVEEKAEAMYRYTLDSLNAIRDGGGRVAMVQIGNETNGTFCGEKTWKKIVWDLMTRAAAAVREFDPAVKICVHFANPENGEAYLNWAGKLAYYSLDYDVFATSYYPYWHGTLDNLKQVLSAIRETYGKDVMVAETSYAYTLEDTDFSGNTIGEGGAYEAPWPFTVQGQASAVREVIDAVSSIGGIGVFYWEGAWITVGGDTWEENHALWESNGAGWASSFAREYDPEDAGKYFGGSACDNQAMFGPDGKALDSLAVFNLVRKGQITEVVPEAVDDTEITVDVGSAVRLPDTVSAVMNDMSRRQVSAEWDLSGLPASTDREGDYIVHGTAGGMKCTARIHVRLNNYVRNPSFEDEDLSMWRVEDRGGCDELYAEEKRVDSLTGVKHWHFYSAKAQGVDFTLEQTLEDLPEGTWRFRVSVMGGDAGDQEVYSYVKIDGQTAETAPAKITSYNNWDTPEIVFACAEGQQVTVGISVRCDGKGAWGKIDDMTVNRLIGE